MTTLKSDAVTDGIKPDYSRAGVVLCRTGMYHAAAQDEIISGDTLQMVPVPKNAQILDITITAKKAGGTLDLAGATGCHVGDGSSSSRFMDDVSLGNVRMLNMRTDGKPQAIGYTYDEGADTIDIAWTSMATVMETDTVIVMNVFYKMAGSIADEDFQTENAAGA
jgi:hypothetical protein